MAEALGGRSPVPQEGLPPPGRLPPQSRLTLTRLRLPARALSASELAGAGSSSSPSPRVRPTFPLLILHSPTPKTDRGAVHSLQGALPPPTQGWGRAPTLLRPLLPSGKPARAHVITFPRETQTFPNLPSQTCGFQPSHGGEHADGAGSPSESHWRYVLPF